MDKLKTYKDRLIRDTTAALLSDFPASDHESGTITKLEQFWDSAFNSGVKSVKPKQTRKRMPTPAEREEMNKQWQLEENRRSYQAELTDIAKYLFHSAVDNNEHVTHDEVVNQAANFLEKIKQKTLEIVNE